MAGARSLPDSDLIAAAPQKPRGCTGEAGQSMTLTPALQGSRQGRRPQRQLCHVPADSSGAKKLSPGEEQRV